MKYSNHVIKYEASTAEEVFETALHVFIDVYIQITKTSGTIYKIAPEVNFSACNFYVKQAKILQ